MKSDYIPVPGLGTGSASFQVSGRHRLYQSPDHLLVVQTSGYTEEYRRVFYRDILCVVIRHNQRYIWTSVVLGIIVLLLCLLLLIPVSWIIVGLLCLPFVIVLVWNFSRGPSCDCYITTRVQTVSIPTPQRLNKVPLLLQFLETKVPASTGETRAS
jgi:hypothetical protein